MLNIHPFKWKNFIYQDTENFLHDKTLVVVLVLHLIKIMGHFKGTQANISQGRGGVDDR